MRNRFTSSSKVKNPCLSSSVIVEKLKRGWSTVGDEEGEDREGSEGRGGGCTGLL
jgi:hypothetical protein